MSWTRFASDSDVYVFENNGGYIECCGCRLVRPDPMVNTVEEMLQHLEQHRAAGHKVPDCCPYKPDEYAAVNADLAKGRAAWLLENSRRRGF